MEENKLIYFISTEKCPFCIHFKNIIEFLNCKDLFQEIKLSSVTFASDIFIQNDTHIYTPIFFYINDGKRVIINNDLLLNKLTKNLELLKNDDFKNFINEKK